MVVNNKTKTARIWQFAKQSHISYPLWSNLFFGIKLELNRLANKLEPHERLIALSPCKWRKRHSLVAITDQRVLVINCGLLGIFSNEQDNSAYYQQISGASAWGRFFHSYKFPTPGTGNTIIITGLWNGDYERINRAYIHTRSKNARMPNNTSDDTISKITRQLKELKQSYNDGDLSSDAYHTMRKRLEDKLLDDEET